MTSRSVLLRIDPKLCDIVVHVSAVQDHRTGIIRSSECFTVFKCIYIPYSQVTHVVRRLNDCSGKCAVSYKGDLIVRSVEADDLYLSYLAEFYDGIAHTECGVLVRGKYKVDLGIVLDHVDGSILCTVSLTVGIILLYDIILGSDNGIAAGISRYRISDRPVLSCDNLFSSLTASLPAIIPAAELSEPI